MNDTTHSIPLDPSTQQGSLTENLRDRGFAIAGLPEAPRDDVEVDTRAAPAPKKEKKARPFFTECRSVSTEKPTDKLVLMLLASYANIWPNGAVMVSASQPWLLAESGLSKNTWVRSMKRLEALKAVKRRRRRADDGTRLTIEYALTPDQAPQVVYPEKTWVPAEPESPPQPRTQNGYVDGGGEETRPSTQTRGKPGTQNRTKPGTQNGGVKDVTGKTSVKTSLPVNQRKRAREQKGAHAPSASPACDIQQRRRIDTPPAKVTPLEPDKLVYRLRLLQATAKLDKAACTQETPPTDPSPGGCEKHRAMHEAVLQVTRWSVFYTRTAAHRCECGVIRLVHISQQGLLDDPTWLTVEDPTLLAGLKPRWRDRPMTPEQAGILYREYAEYPKKDGTVDAPLCEL